MGRPQGYITMDAEQVFSACARYLSARSERIEKAKADFIKKEMNKRWFPAKTEEKALARSMGPYDICPFWEISGGYWAASVQDLESAAFAAMAAAEKNPESRQVLVSIELADCLKKYWNEKEHGGGHEGTI